MKTLAETLLYIRDLQPNFTVVERKINFNVRVYKQISASSCCHQKSHFDLADPACKCELGTFLGNKVF